MNRLATRIAKSASQRTGLTLLTMLVVLGVSGAVVLAANSKPDFSLSALPSPQTITAGQTATFSVGLSPVNGYTGAATLAASGLPTGATATFTPSTVSATAGSSLSVHTTTSTPAGSYTVTITGTDSQNPKLSEQTSAALVVQQPDFSLTASPSTQSIFPGDSASFTVGLSRTGGFTGPVSLTVAGVPTGSTSSFTPATLTSSTTSSTLQVVTSGNTPPGTYTVTTTGAGAPGTHAASVTVVVQQPGFTLSGNLASPLNLGGSGEPLDLTISNPLNQPLKLSNIAVVVNGTSKPDCPASQFSVTQIPASYTLSIAKNTTATLSQLGSQYLPVVKWVDAPYPQNSCLGAHLTFGYSATGDRTPPGQS